MVSIISIPPFIMAAIALYVCISYAIMYLRRKDEPENLWFSVMCGTISFYDTFSALLYMSQSPQQSAIYQRFQFATLALFIIAVTWFIGSLVHINETVAYCITILMAIFIVLGFLGAIVTIQ